MAEYCDNFMLQEQEAERFGMADGLQDSFESWDGRRGPAGPAGPAGPPGSSVELKGPVASTSNLPETAPSSELWLVGAAAPYHGWFYNGSSWKDAGEIAVGPEGPPGADGTDGADGTTFTPTVSSAGVISWTNDGGKQNPASVNIKGPQGDPGSAGADGTTFTPTVSSAGVISWTNDGGKQNPASVNIKGPQGDPGSAGADGTTFTPTVSSAGVISWTNDGGKQNPESVNIKGPQGDPGQGVPTGGSAGQVLAKASGTDYDTAWINDPIATFPRPNLLVNWYFEGGGSQLGAGIFPLNHGGLTTYSALQFKLDGWDSDAGTFTLSPSGFNASVPFYQTIRNDVVTNLLGKKITLSALFSDRSLEWGTVEIPSSVPSSLTFLQASDNLLAVIGLTGGGLSWMQLFRMTAQNKTIVAVKAEIGETQTLAHQEGALWYLNEIPNWEEELIKARTRNNTSDTNANKTVLFNVIEEVTAFSNTAISAGGFKEVNPLSVAKAGYKAVGIVGVSIQGSGASGCDVGSIFITSGTSALVRVMNHSNSNASSITCTIQVLYCVSI